MNPKVVPKPVCEYALRLSFSGRPSAICGRGAKYLEGGRHFCGTHAPSLRKARQEKRQAAWREARAALDAVRQANRDAREIKNAKAESFEPLYRALAKIRGGDNNPAETAREVLAALPGEIISDIEPEQKT